MEKTLLEKAKDNKNKSIRERTKYTEEHLDLIIALLKDEISPKQFMSVLSMAQGSSGLYKAISMLRYFYSLDKIDITKK